MPKLRKPLAFVPDFSATFGQNLRRLLEARGIRDAEGMKAAAKAMGCEVEMLQSLINDETTLKPGVSGMLEKGTGVRAAFWEMVEKRCRKNSA